MTKIDVEMMVFQPDNKNHVNWLNIFVKVAKDAATTYILYT